MPLIGEPEPEVYARLAAKGMDAATAWPPSLGLGRSFPPLEEELAFVETFAERVVRPLGEV